MEFTEKELEDMIYQTPNDKLRDRGLLIYGKKLRQTTIGNYGRSDLIAISTNNSSFINLPKGVFNIEVFELKKDAITTDTLMQGINYVRGVRHWVSIHRPKLEFNVSLNLVGSAIETENNSLIYIPYILYGVNFYTYSYAFDGIRFERVGEHCLTNHNLRDNVKIIKSKNIPDGKNNKK